MAALTAREADRNLRRSRQGQPGHFHRMPRQGAYHIDGIHDDTRPQIDQKVKEMPPVACCWRIAPCRTGPTSMIE